MISAIVLAAGNSQRMGIENKMLLPFRGTTIISTVLQQLEHSEVNEIILVTGLDKKIIEEINDGANKIKVVVNEQANEGLTSSIQCGIKAANNSAKGFLICLGDMPLLTSEDYNLLNNKLLNTNTKQILTPVKNFKKGNPVVFSCHFKNEILQLKYQGGCKPIVLENEEYVKEVEVFNNHFFVDIDTPEDFQIIV